jgi:Ca2+/Na+ antiporter
MRWLVLLAAAVATVFALQILAAERRRGGSRTTLGQLAAAMLWLAILGAILYAAHWIGLFSLPLVAVAFVPFALVARWSILATREARRRRDDAAAAQPPPSRSARLLELAAWPVFLSLVVLVLAIGIFVATLVGPP